MDDNHLLPFVEDTQWLLRYPKLPLHRGIGKVRIDGAFENPIVRKFREFQLGKQLAQASSPEWEFEASIFVPAAGNCKIFLRSSDRCPLSPNFGDALTVTGESSDGPFRMICPRYYVRLTSETSERPGWAVASPINERATIRYGDARPVATVKATINNFDFDCGNLRSAGNDGPHDTLRVEAAGRMVDFVWRTERLRLRKLVDAGVLGTTSFVTFSFAAWPGASDSDLADFAHNVSSLCSCVVGQHTGIPILSFFDVGGRVIRRIVGSSIESKFRDNCVLRALHPEDCLPQLFRQCFEEHCRLQKLDLWRHMPAFCASIEDPPYLEQKYSTLMAAVERLIRSSLIEAGFVTPIEAESKNLAGLIGMARGKLRWNVPGHYTKAERYRETRNAVDHGGALPHDAAQVRADFDKWKLFLNRRLFIRLGFDGMIQSPQSGLVSESPVSEFSGEHNSFRE